MTAPADDDKDDDIPLGDLTDDADRDDDDEGDGPEDLLEDGSEDRVDPNDMMSPPKVPCECYCLHCNRTFMSDGIWFQKVINDRNGFKGFWMCPTPNCDGAGFTFDIFPTDPTHPANRGWHYFEDDEDEELEFDEHGDAIEPTGEREYDPDESKYKALDEEMGPAEEDIIDGDEWKLGLEPGQPPPESEQQRQARLEWEEEQKRYDQPDERPRILDWKDKDDSIRDEDIPF